MDDWPSGLGHFSKNCKVPSSNQPHYEAPCDLWVEIVKTQ